MNDQKIRVLVIDDEKGLRDMLAYSLGAKGYAVTAAESGRRALEIARGGEFDVVLCDVMMPEMGGVETLRALRSLRPGLEVVMVTGYATIENAVESMKVGAYDYVSKPYDLDHISSILKKACERGRLRVQVGRLEREGRLKSEFLANMSHEQRAVLNAIVGEASALAAGAQGPVPSAQADALGRILAASEDLIELIDGLLEYSKLEGGDPERLRRIGTDAL